MTRKTRLDLLLDLRALRKQVSLQKLRELDLKSKRRQAATVLARQDHAAAQATADNFLNTALAGYENRGPTGTFFKSLALGHLHAQRTVQAKHQHLEYLNRREEIVAAERLTLARAHVAQVLRYDQMAGCVKDSRIADQARGEAASERDHQDLFANGGRYGTS